MKKRFKEANSGAWIFVSHSHRDLDKVHQIRTELERRRHHPLRFFLKCLEADDARLPELICEERRVDVFTDAMLDFRP
jgi:hypothetical protein